MSLTETIRKLRRDAVELEQQAVDQEKHDSHVAALQRERAYAEVRLEHGLRLGDKRETIQGGGPLHTAVKTGAEIAAEAERALAAIDAELVRARG